MNENLIDQIIENGVSRVSNWLTAATSCLPIVGTMIGGRKLVQLNNQIETCGNLVEILNIYERSRPRDEVLLAEEIAFEEENPRLVRRLAHRMEQDEEIHRAPLMEDLQEEVAVEQPAPDRRREAIAELGDILDEGHLGQPVLQLIDQGEEEELPEPDFEPLGGREGDNLPSILDRQQLQAIREDLEKLLPRRHFATPAAAKAALLRLNITLIEQQSLFSWTTAISGILGEASCVATFAAGFFKDSMPMMATAGIGGLLVGGVTTAVLGLGLINLARQVRIESYRLS